MASLLLLTLIFANLFSPSSFVYSFPFSIKSTQIPVTRKPSHQLKVSCNAVHDETLLPKFDWKKMLLGLGVYFDATTPVSNPLSCVDDDENNKPVEPDFSSCKRDRSVSGTTTCCPPLEASKEIIDFELPPQPNQLRVRKPAHTLTDDYVAKYKKAVELMKELPDDDPRSFYNLANVHCAYCEGFYSQVGFPDIELRIHYSWLFYPFHRGFLYFVERIMGDLIDDPDFALPFWNWDSPSGMTMPPIYTDKESPLYNAQRDPSHQPPVFADFDYEKYINTTGRTPSYITNDIQREINLAVMYRDMVSGAKTATLFYGSRYVAGEKGEPGGGLVEYSPHDAVHDWTGSHGEDMGYFYSAARDPIFYAHHAGIDRLWSIWKKLPGGRKDLNDSAWLDSSFLFYNEKQELVRIKVRDCLDTEKLGYRYEDVAKPWLNKRPKTDNKFKGTAMKIRKFGVAKAANVFPRRFDKLIKVMVPRPKKNRSKKEKEEEEEVLLIEGIEVTREKFIKFDVLINYDEDEDERTWKRVADRTEFAGSFVNLPRKHHRNSKVVEKLKTSQRFGISELLEDLGAEDDDHVQVTLVPRFENIDVSINGIKIVFEG